MAKDLYVRVKPKSQSKEFFRCGIQFGLLWVLVTDLDDATAERLQNEQMLETSVEKPEGFDHQVEETPADEVGKGSTLTPDAQTGLVGSGLLPSLIRYDTGFEITLGDLVQQAHTASGLSVDDWNGLTDQARETLLQVYVDQLNHKYGELAAMNKTLQEVETVRDGLLDKVNQLAADLEEANKKLAAGTKPAETTQAPAETPAAEKTTTKTKAK